MSILYRDEYQYNTLSMITICLSHTHARTHILHWEITSTEVWIHFPYKYTSASHRAVCQTRHWHNCIIPLIPWIKPSEHTATRQSDPFHIIDHGIWHAQFQYTSWKRRCFHGMQVGTHLGWYTGHNDHIMSYDLAGVLIRLTTDDVVQLMAKSIQMLIP